MKGLLMVFEKYIAIDWSGDKKERQRNKIQVAEYDPVNRTVSIVRSPNGNWSREDVFENVRHWVAGNRILIGFDFAFAYPYCDRGEYFPDEPASPVDVQHLWKTVEQVCRLDDNFYGGPFYKGEDSPFRGFHLYRKPRDARCEERYRETDQRAIDSAGRNPSSVFKCVGPNQVGTGSIAGMRFLHRVRQEQIAAIWPFDTTDVPLGSAVVEIYPRVFLHHAETNCGNRPPLHTVEAFLACYGATLQGAPEIWTDDERDALVSAAAMGWFAKQPLTWQAPTHAPCCAATHEGWVFGVQ